MYAARWQVDRLPDVDELFELALLIAAVDVLDEAHDAVQGGMGEHHCILRGQEGLKKSCKKIKLNKTIMHRGINT